MTNSSRTQLTHFIFLVISGLAVFGSLYFSEILNLPPCSLCWYQRIFMFPIFLITFIQVLRGEFPDFIYQIIFSTLGLSVSIYHNLLYYNFIENIVPCSQGVSCTSKQIEWFGFVTIPLLSLSAFIILFALTTYGLYLKGRQK